MKRIFRLFPGTPPIKESPFNLNLNEITPLLTSLIINPKLI